MIFIQFLRKNWVFCWFLSADYAVFNVFWQDNFFRQDNRINKIYSQLLSSVFWVAQVNYPINIGGIIPYYEQKVKEKMLFLATKGTKFLDTDWHGLTLILLWRGCLWQPLCAWHRRPLKASFVGLLACPRRPMRRLQSINTI